MKYYQIFSAKDIKSSDKRKNGFHTTLRNLEWKRKCFQNFETSLVTFSGANKRSKLSKIFFKVKHAPIINAVVFI